MRPLGELLDGLVEPAVRQAAGRTIVTGLADDSRQAQAGGLFVALRGSAADGRQYIHDAVQRGARVIVGEDVEAVDGVQVLRVPDARAILARLAVRWYRLDEALRGGFRLLGVTGTNGKSTTAFMTHAILREAGMKCALLGTVHHDLCARSVKARMTTPGPLELAAYLRESVDAGANAAVMEVSSHALAQRRTDGLRFAAAAYTNLSGDHLDYHGTFENYLAAKQRLFAQLDDQAVAVVNRDDANQAAVLRDCRATVRYYSLKQDADLVAAITRESVDGTHYRVRLADGGRLVLENAIVGRHNVYNALAALGLARAIGVPLEALEAGLAAVRNIPGRLQRVPCMSNAEVFVDYAHTDDALRNVLSVLRPLTRRRLIVVFGAGGDRDCTKRPRMAQAVSEFADAIIVTSDNPRTEDPQRIIADILAGFDDEARRRVSTEPDRRRAIRAALAAVDSGDVVLIAGKGHEDYQILGDTRVHFDDVEEALQAASELAHVPGGSTIP